MRKNVASQTIGVQMVSATDGSAFTGAVSALVTGDAGTQAAGGGTVTHEGNGYHSYAPTQAETNFDHVAFTFTGTGAVPATVQVYTRYDANVSHFGGDAGTFSNGVPSVDVFSLDNNDTAATNLQTMSLNYAAGALAATVSGVAAGGITAASIATGAIDADAVAADAVTEIQAGLATAASVAALNDITAAEVLAAGDIDGYTLEEFAKLALAALAGKLSGAATTTVTIRAADDSKARITATVDSDGNRTALTLDETG